MRATISALSLQPKMEWMLSLYRLKLRGAEEIVVSTTDDLNAGSITSCDTAFVGLQD